MAPSRRRWLFALAGTLAVPLLIACNGIVGLSDYSRAECNGGELCTDGGTTDGPIVTDGSSDGEAGRVDGGVGADPVSWARWRMPNYALDGATLPNQPILTSGPDEITDTITQLIWRKTVEGNGLATLEQAQTTCKTIAPSGTWRVPKRIELVTLLDYGRTGGPFIEKSFIGFPSARVWTSSEVRPFTGGLDQAY